MITAEMNYMAKRCYRVPCMPRFGEKSEFIYKGKSPDSYSLPTCAGFPNIVDHPGVFL